MKKRIKLPKYDAVAAVVEAAERAQARLALQDIAAALGRIADRLELASPPDPLARSSWAFRTIDVGRAAVYSKHLGGKLRKKKR